MDKYNFYKKNENKNSLHLTLILLTAISSLIFQKLEGISNIKRVNGGEYTL